MKFNLINLVSYECLYFDYRNNPDVKAIAMLSFLI